MKKNLIIFTFVMVAALCGKHAWAQQTVTGTGKVVIHLTGEDLDYSRQPEFIEENTTFPQAVDLGMDLNTKEELLKAVFNYFSLFPDALKGMSLQNFRLKDVRFLPSDNFRLEKVYIDFEQITREGLVVKGGTLQLTISEEGDKTFLQSVTLRAVPEIEEKLAEGKFSKPELFNITPAQALNIKEGMPALHKEFYVTFVNGAWRKVVKYRFDDPSGLAVLVDPQTNQVIGVIDERSHAIIGQGGSTTTSAFNNSPSAQSLPPTNISNTSSGGGIRGNVHGFGKLFGPAGPNTPLDDLLLKDLQLTLTSGNFKTTTLSDINGNFTFPNNIASGVITATLNGPWVKVVSMDNLFPYISLNATNLQPVDVLFNPSLDYNTILAQVNAHYHTTLVHDYVKKQLPLATGIDIPILANVNYPIVGKLNLIQAWYSNKTINFPVGFFIGSQFIGNSAQAQTIYHEYGHFVDDMVGGLGSSHSLEEDAHNEGTADIVAIYTRGQPLPQYGTNNMYYYPLEAREDEVHVVGSSLATFATELKQNLQSSYGQTQGTAIAESLVFGTIFANTRVIPDFIWQLILLADNDNNLTNGFPYSNEILSAARKHGLEPFLTPSLTLIAPAHKTSLKLVNNPITLTASVGSSLNGLPFTTLQFQYGKGRQPQNWINLGSAITTPGTVSTQWDTRGLTPGVYTVRALVKTILGFDFQYYNIVYYEGDNITRNPWHGPKGTTEQYFFENASDADKDLVAWVDDYGPNLTIGYADVKRGLKTLLPNLGFDQISPAVSGNRIAWTDYRDGANNANIYTLDVTTGQVSGLKDTAQKNQIHPDISGNLLVTESDTNGNWDIWLTDLINPGSTRPLTSGSDSEGNPSISGTYVAWEVLRAATNDYDVEVYDITTGKKVTLSKPGNQRYPDINLSKGGVRLVYEDDASGNKDIVYCQYDTAAAVCPEQRLTSDPNDQQYPKMNGYAKVVWEDHRAGVAEIYEFDVINGTVQNMTPNEPWHENRFPAITDQDIFYTNRDKNIMPTTDVYSVKIPYEGVAVTSDAFDQQNPRGGTQKIVFEDNSRGNWDTAVYDESLNSVRIITTNAADQKNPDIFQNTIVYEDNGQGISQISGYNLTNQQFFILPPTLGNQYKPTIASNYLVWETHQTNKVGLAWYDFNKPLGVNVLLPNTGTTSLPQVDIIGYAVYESTYNGNKDIFRMQLGNLASITMLTTQGADQLNPDYDGSNIVWEDLRNGTSDIYGLINGVEKPIETHPSFQMNPSVQGDYIVWQDDRYGNWDIFLHKLSSGITYQMTSEPSDQINPAMTNGYLYWQDNRSGRDDIYKSPLP